MVVREELEGLAAEYRHLRSEHLRARPEGRVRRHLGARLDRLERHFERLLEEWVREEAVREAWRKHLHRGAPAPAEPGTARAPLLFKGRSPSGSVVEVRARPDGDCDVLVDDVRIERVAAAEELARPGNPLTFRVDHEDFLEIFCAPEPALAAARAYFADPAGEPPWEVAGELAADGLADATFALTPRGRRALAEGGRR